MNQFLRNHDRTKQITGLAQPSIFQTFLVIFFDWACVFACTSLVYFYSAWWIPAALIVIGSRQRALVVLTHEAAHCLLASKRNVNDAIANLFLCFPMVKSLKHYRAVHLPHHKYLGDTDHDPDMLHDPAAMKGGWFNVYCKYLLAYDQWIIAELTQMFKKISLRHMLCLALWWGVVLSALAITVGPAYAATFLVLWFVARAVMYHVITTFIIISDHHGLFPGTILEYTRNHPSSGVMRWFIHPHNNGFHLTHHLAPFVPFYNLDKARRLLAGWDRYDRAEQCATYFLGNKSVIKSWNKSTAANTDVPLPWTINTQPAMEALEAVMAEDADITFGQDSMPVDETGKRVA